MAKPEVRLSVVGVAFAVGLAALVVRAAQVQLLDGARYAADAAAQRTDSVVLPAPRGTLYDRNGVPLATTIESYHVGVLARALRDPRRDPERLARQLGLAEREVRRALRKRYAYFRGPFSSAQVHELRGMPGVDLHGELVRNYPDPDFARPVLGRPGADGRAAGGIERVLDSLLSGVPGAAVVLRDGRGRIYESPSRLEAFPVPGYDVTLTLDAGLQEIVETALEDAIARLDAAGGDVVVVDPHTGEVLAVASRDAHGGATSGAFASVFEPGSTAKIFAAAALLEHELVGADDSVYGEGGRWVLPHRVLEEDHEHDFTWMTLAQAVQVSSNIGTVKFASRLERPAQYSMLRAFGFGAPTGVEFPAESRGLLWRPAQWSGTTAQALAIGYEVAVTPLQLAMAYGAIANDGVLLRASLVKAITDPRGRTIYQHRPEPVRRAVRRDVAARLRDMLLGVVSERGTGASAALSTYALAGKTGTARVAGPNGYVPGAHTAVFAALFPAEDPQLTMVVKLDSPRGSYAALTAAPLTRRVLEQLLAARTGALDRGRLTREVGPPRPTAAPREEEAFGRHVFRWPDPDTTDRATGGRVPDVIGLGLREAVGQLHRAGLHVRVEGRGNVVRTSPAVGDSVGPGRVVTLFAQLRT